MVFGNPSDPGSSLHEERYSTRHEALVGHTDCVLRVKKGEIR